MQVSLIARDGLYWVRTQTDSGSYTEEETGVPVGADPAQCMSLVAERIKEVIGRHPTLSLGYSTKTHLDVEQAFDSMLLDNHDEWDPDNPPVPWLTWLDNHYEWDPDNPQMSWFPPVSWLTWKLRVGSFEYRGTAQSVACGLPISPFRWPDGDIGEPVDKIETETSQEGR